MTYLHVWFLAASLATLAGCAPASHEPREDGSGGATDAPAATNRVEIPALVRHNLGITFAQVEARHVAQTIRVPGAFEIQPLARHEYRMALPGRVELLVDEYQPVEAGVPLYRYQSPSWPELLHEILLGEQAMDTARAEIGVGRAKLLEARRTLEATQGRLGALAQADLRHADLEAQAARIEASLPRLRAELALAETRLANAERTRQHALHRAATASGFTEAELEEEVPAVGPHSSEDDAGDHVQRYLTIDWIEVPAAQSGIVETLAVTDGAFIEAYATVLSMVDPSQVRFRAHALQADLPAISSSPSARIVPPHAPGLPFDGGVDATTTVGLEGHPQERTVTLIAHPQEQAEWIRPGVSAFLEIVVKSSDGPALAIPRSSIVQDGLTHVFFRRDPSDPNKAIRVEADLGVSDGRWVVLESGVMRGDEVVLTGAYELKLAAQQSGAVLSGGHVHADGSVHDDH